MPPNLDLLQKIRHLLGCIKDPAKLGEFDISRWQEKFALSIQLPYSKSGDTTIENSGRKFISSDIFVLEKILTNIKLILENYKICSNRDTPKSGKFFCFNDNTLLLCENGVRYTEPNIDLTKPVTIKELEKLYHSQLESSKQNALLTKTISWLNDPSNQSAMQKKGVGQQAAHVDSAVRLLTDWKNQTEIGKAVSLPKYYHATGKTNPKTISLILTSGEILVSDKGSMGPGAFISTHDESALYGPEKEKPAFTIALTQKVESIAARYFPVNPKRTKAHLTNYDHGLWIAVDKNISLKDCSAYIITDDHIASDHAALDEYITKEQRSKIPVVERSVADIVRYALDATIQPEPKPTQWRPCAGPGRFNFFYFTMPATKNWPQIG